MPGATIHEAVMEMTFLERLNRLLERTNRTVPFWLEDLLSRGPRLEEWQAANAPNRVAVTEFLARWLKFAGLSQDECLEWLLPYCSEVLAVYSKSSPSSIRHGTKANTRWVYASAFPFDFEAMVRDLPEAAFQGQPSYFPVFEKWREELGQMKIKARESYVPPVLIPYVPVKERFKEQFQKAVAFARSQKADGAQLARIVELLNEQGFLTKTGRKWTMAALSQALRPDPWA
jgi:hypothetical protein